MGFLTEKPIHTLVTGDRCYCPVAIASGCCRGNTCDRVLLPTIEEELNNTNTMYSIFTAHPSCYVGQTLECKYHEKMGKVHRMLRRHNYRGKLPHYTEVKYYTKKCGFSVYEIGMLYINKKP